MPAGYHAPGWTTKKIIPPRRKPPGSPRTPYGSARIPKPGPAPRSPFDAYQRGSSNNAYQQAVAIVENFLSIMGWPAGIKAENLQMALLKHGLELTPERAYNYLFTKISTKLQAANPNAEFGLTQDNYVQQLNSLKDSFSYFTGDNNIPHEVLRMAIDQGWTQSEMLEFLKKDHRFTNPSDLPWLQAGQGYRDVANQFVQTYGSAPTDTKQLASWFKFRTGAQSVAAGGPAQLVAPPLPGQATRGSGIGTGQSEIR